MMRTIVGSELSTSGPLGRHTSRTHILNVNG